MAFPIMLLLATAVTANQQRNAAKAQEIEFERQADEEKLSAEGRELERRQKLNDVLSSNIVSLSSSGMAGEGTPQSISLESAEQASLSEGMLGLSERLKQSELKRRGSNARKQGDTQAASTLLSGAYQGYKLS